MPPVTPSLVHMSREPVMLATGVTSTLRFFREQVGGTLEHRVIAAHTAPARRGKKALGMAGAAGRTRRGD